ncbi:DNA-3-methyladenine glycosylase [Carnobacterium inhibens]|uniref:DNA-3-methyladenine glycosylase n=1 Tax=Carnobacterium inhibens TaxID=147709 RepID=UPI00203C71E5|nr:DNA-3-methyladenine glycosylase [Carnobacterium inhibens]MCM3512563.1 DNA-3-methyladenine glycosylase [Carnobacterium inhibens]
MDFWTDHTKTTEEIAQDLLGCLVIKETDEGVTSGWIVETEAYLGEIDEAAHSFGLKSTPRLASMYKEPGTIYVYSMHTHLMLNAVVQEKGIPEAILIRAIEPYKGMSLMSERRGKTGFVVTDGPGKLTKAMNITKLDDGTLAWEPPLRIDVETRKIPKKIELSPRIGIPNKGKWTDALLRYTVVGNPYVSRKKGKIEADFGWNDPIN